LIPSFGNWKEEPTKTMGDAPCWAISYHVHSYWEVFNCEKQGLYIVGVGG